MIRTTGRALLIHDGHVLAIKYQENNQVFYALPGGGQETGESLHQNFKRECQEELGIDVKIGELMFVREWLDEERHVHQLEFIFECSSYTKIEAVHSVVPDGSQIGIEWLPIANILSHHIYPLEMREHLHNLVNGQTKIPVYLGSS
ncbi:NUDIX domain-containing protein [Alicyclobacillus mengziensis]|uniref:NUDIX domain-containing protein n=1 Tax=Alicyclobacillus mengziensis TaxID=2931921 RepID=A0A9X7VYG5_9BACL|nr:NUDIX domain-containing protein [Alicyclobacillus mengziensis]QSO47346.1 NUDIX domain-containing protein [Alicyclobacillus mengziensis]